MVIFDTDSMTFQPTVEFRNFCSFTPLNCSKVLNDEVRQFVFTNYIYNIVFNSKCYFFLFFFCDQTKDKKK